MKIAHVNAHIVDGLGGSYAGHLVVDGDRITEIGPGEPKAADQMSRVDMKGRTITPGLIDCHVHLRNDGVADPRAQSAADTDATAVLRAARNAAKSLNGGITTVRDCGCRNHISFSLRRAALEGLCKSPRLMLSGAMICITGGHGWQLGLEADGPDGVRRAARQQLKAGADNVKLIASGGILTPGTEIGAPQFTVEEIRAAADEAHAAGKTCCAHAHGTQAIKNATRGGVDSVEHGYLIDDEGIDLMIERGTYLVATSAAVRNVVKHGVAAGIKPDVVRKASSAIEQHIDGFKRAHKAGVKLAMGTDSGVPFTDHGNNLDELVYLVEMGMPPIDAIGAATLQAARLLRIDDRVGSLEVGKLADFVVFEKDPLKDIAIVQNKDNIRQVVVGGKVMVDRDTGMLA
jgi:imidazolonepropionase-like amidohydrolase